MPGHSALRRIAFLLVVAAGSIPVCTFGQGYPLRPITLIYPYAVGGGLDAVMRQINKEASNVLGQPVIMENRPGANTRLGVTALRQSPADGYLVTVAADTLLVHQTLMDPELKLEAGRDYSPVIFLFKNSLVFAAHPSVPFRDIKGLVAYAKAHPGKLNWAYTPGSVSQFGLDMFKQAVAVEVTGVPFKGTGDALLNLLSGVVDLQISSSALKNHIASGKLVGLATTGKQRSEAFSALPTLIESGIPISQETWFGLVTSAGVSKEIIGKLFKAFSAALQLPTTRKLLQAEDRVPDTNMTTEDFAALVKSEKEVWLPIIRRAGLKLQ